MKVLAFFVSSIFIFSGCSSRFDTPAVAETVIAGADSREIARAKSAVDANPNSPNGYIQLASAYIYRSRETGDHAFNKQAESAVEKALSIEPDNITARKLHASLLASGHDFPAARAAAAELVKEMPTDAFAYGILVDSALAMGDYEAAIKASQKMVDLKPNSSSYARVAHVRSVHGDHKGAVEMLIAAARTADPQDKEAQSWCLFQLGKEYFKAGDLTKAEAVIDESLQISPKYPLALIEKGRLRAAAGDMASAESLLRQASQFSTQPEALILLGDIRFVSGQPDQAREQYRAAEEYVRSTTGDIHRFALLWAERGERLDEALSIATDDYETNKDIYASDILAWCFYKNGRYAEAKEKIGEARKFNTGDARILYHAGMIEKALGNSKNARKLLHEAIQANPHFDLIGAKEAKLALQNLNMKS